MSAFPVPDKQGAATRAVIPEKGAVARSNWASVYARLAQLLSHTTLSPKMCTPLQIQPGPRSLIRCPAFGSCHHVQSVGGAAEGKPQRNPRAPDSFRQSACPERLSQPEDPRRADRRVLYAHFIV
jgi:hypothetical protein